MPVTQTIPAPPEHDLRWRVPITSRRSDCADPKESTHSRRITWLKRSDRLLRAKWNRTMPPPTATLTLSVVTAIGALHPALGTSEWWD